MFNCFQLYRLDKDWPMTAHQLEETLSRFPFQPCGSQDMKSAGWVSPQPGGPVVHQQGRQWLLSLCIEKKSVPAAMIRKVAEERAREIEAQQGHAVGRKQMKELKEMALQELLPRAFPKQERVSVWVNAEDGWILINTTTPAKADDVIGTFMNHVEQVPAKMVHTQFSPATAMVDWLVSGDAPAGFTVDRECELKAPEGDKPSVKYSRLSLEREEIKQHISEGKLPTFLGLTWDDRMSFILTDKLQFKKVTVLDEVLKENVESAEDADALFHSTFALMVGELSRFLPDMIEALGGECEQET